MLLRASALTNILVREGLLAKKHFPQTQKKKIVEGSSEDKSTASYYKKDHLKKSESTSGAPVLKVTSIAPKVTNDLIGCKKVTNDLIGCKKVTNDLIGCKKVTNDLIGCKKVTNDLIRCKTEGQQSVVFAQSDSSFKEAGQKRRRNEKKLNSSQEFKKTIIVQTESNKQTSSQVSNTNGVHMKAINAKSLKEKQLPSASSLSRKRHRSDSDDETNDEESPHKNRRVVPV